MLYLSPPPCGFRYSCRPKNPFGVDIVTCKANEFIIFYSNKAGARLSGIGCIALGNPTFIKIVEHPFQDNMLLWRY